LDFIAPVRMAAGGLQRPCAPATSLAIPDAMVASIGDAKSFSNARQLPASLGIVPRQDSSGGKPTLRGISKRGDVYLRTLLIHGRAP
jgi:transposase